jgi:NTP pyrophosphatase (non-canonical NTP hydrolase)
MAQTVNDQAPSGASFTDDEIKEICRSAVYKFGDRSQLLKLAEECCELAQAAIKAANGLPANLVEEAADVKIMLIQLMSMLDSELIENWLQFKIGRLKTLVEG